MPAISNELEVCEECQSPYAAVTTRSGGHTATTTGSEGQGKARRRRCCLQCLPDCQDRLVCKLEFSEQLVTPVTEYSNVEVVRVELLPRKPLPEEKQGPEERQVTEITTNSQGHRNGHITNVVDKTCHNGDNEVSQGRRTGGRGQLGSEIRAHGLDSQAPGLGQSLVLSSGTDSSVPQVYLGIKGPGEACQACGSPLGGMPSLTLPGSPCRAASTPSGHPLRPCATPGTPLDTQPLVSPCSQAHYSHSPHSPLGVATHPAHSAHLPQPDLPGSPCTCKHGLHHSPDCVSSCLSVCTQGRGLVRPAPCECVYRGGPVTSTPSSGPPCQCVYRGGPVTSTPSSARVCSVAQAGCHREAQAGCHREALAASEAGLLSVQCEYGSLSSDPGTPSLSAHCTSHGVSAPPAPLPGPGLSAPPAPLPRPRARGVPCTCSHTYRDHRGETTHRDRSTPPQRGCGCMQALANPGNTPGGRGSTHSHLRTPQHGCYGDQYRDCYRDDSSSHKMGSGHLGNDDRDPYCPELVNSGPGCPVCERCDIKHAPSASWSGSCSACSACSACYASRVCETSPRQDSAWQSGLEGAYTMSGLEEAYTTARTDFSMDSHSPRGETHRGNSIQMEVINSTRPRDSVGDLHVYSERPGDRVGDVYSEGSGLEVYKEYLRQLDKQVNVLRDMLDKRQQYYIDVVHRWHDKITFQLETAYCKERDTVARQREAYLCQQRRHTESHTPGASSDASGSTHSQNGVIQTGNKGRVSDIATTNGSNHGSDIAKGVRLSTPLPPIPTPPSIGEQALFCLGAPPALSWEAFGTLGVCRTQQPCSDVPRPLGPKLVTTAVEVCNFESRQGEPCDYYASGLSISSTNQIIVTDVGIETVKIFQSRRLVGSLNILLTDNPTRAVVLPDGRIAVSCASEVKLYNPTGEYSKTLSPDISCPQGIALAPHQGELLVGAYTRLEELSDAADKLHVFDTTTLAPRESVTWRMEGVHLCRARYFAVTDRGDVAASDHDDHTVKVISRRSGEVRGTLGGLGTALGELSSPAGLCTDRFGNIIVADSGNHRVQVFSPQGEALGVVVGSEHELRTPMDVAIDNQGHLVVLQGDGKVRTFRYIFDAEATA